MNKRIMLFSLPLLLWNIPVLMTGETGLLFPLLWLTAILVSPLFTAPLFAGETARGTDLLLLTRPVADGELVISLYRKGYLSFLQFMSIPVFVSALILLALGEDPGSLLVSLATMAGGLLMFTGIGLFISSLCSRTVTAWLFTYMLLLPMNFIPSFLPRVTDPLFTGYIPFSVMFLLPGIILLAGEAQRVVLAWKREDRTRKKLTLRLIPVMAGLAVFSFLPGGMDLTMSGAVRMNRTTARVVRSLDDPLYIRWYRSSSYRLFGDGLEGWEAFLFSLRFKGGRGVRFALPRLSDEDILTLADEREWNVQTVEKRGGYAPFVSALEIEYRGIIETLPLVYNPLIGEEQFLAALQRLIADNVPTAGIVRGRSDRNLGEFWSVLNGALEEYFLVEDYTGRADELEAESPDCLFVLGGRDLSDWEVSRIFRYIDEGGAALVTLSPYELDPVRTDGIARTEDSPLNRELEQRGIYGGDSFIVDPDRGLFLSSGDSNPPDFYPLWFNTGVKNLFDYNALWSVPLYYTGEETPLWQVDSSDQSYTAGSLRDLNPESLRTVIPAGFASYTTCLALPEGEGLLTVLSGEESLSNLMALADRDMSNSAWVQSLAFFLSRNEELLELRRITLRRNW